MKFGLQPFCVCCYTPDGGQTFENVMAISPEDAYQQLCIRGFKPTEWITEDAEGVYKYAQHTRKDV